MVLGFYFYFTSSLFVFLQNGSKESRNIYLVEDAAAGRCHGDGGVAMETAELNAQVSGAKKKNLKMFLYNLRAAG